MKSHTRTALGAATAELWFRVSRTCLEADA